MLPGLLAMPHLPALVTCTMTLSCAMLVTGTRQEAA